MDLIRYIDHPESAPPGPVQLPTRKEVRAVVMAHARELRAALRRGEISEHVALDQQDRVSAYLVALEASQGEKAAVTFLQIWNEETQAAISAIDREAQALLQQAEESLAQAARAEADVARAASIDARVGDVIGQLIAAAILFAFFYFIFQM